VDLLEQDAFIAKFQYRYPWCVYKLQAIFLQRTFNIYHCKFDVTWFCEQLIECPFPRTALELCALFSSDDDFEDAEGVEDAIENLVMWIGLRGVEGLGEWLCSFSPAIIQGVRYNEGLCGRAM
jgi:hypothetical protein